MNILSLAAGWCVPWDERVPRVCADTVEPASIASVPMATMRSERSFMIASMFDMLVEKRCNRHASV